MTEDPNQGVQPGPVSRLVAAVYDLATRGMEQEVWSPQRRQLLAAARGRVLDIGAGTGANLPHYRAREVSDLVLLDRSAGMLARAGRKLRDPDLEVALVQRRAEQLPFEAQTFDTVVFTLSLCTIPQPAAALREARRVLRPGGTLLVLEHVRAEEPGLAAWQDRLTPLWSLVNQGCHPNRDTRATIEAAGFTFETVREFRETKIPLAVVQPHLVGRATASG